VRYLVRVRDEADVALISPNIYGSSADLVLTQPYLDGVQYLCIGSDFHQLGWASMKYWDKNQHYFDEVVCPSEWLRRVK